MVKDDHHDLKLSSTTQFIICIGQIQDEDDELILTLVVEIRI